MWMNNKEEILVDEGEVNEYARVSVIVRSYWHVETGEIRIEIPVIMVGLG